MALQRAGRPIVIVVDVAPSADFLRLSAAASWRTTDGSVVASAPVTIQHGDANLAPVSEDAVDLPRVPALERSGERDLFYPPAYAEYD